MADGYNTHKMLYENLISYATINNSADGYSSVQSIVDVIGNATTDKGTLLDVFIGSDNAYSYTQYFKMRGYYATGNVYETWTSANLPNLNPPSGHTLSDIVIVAVWFA